jgi:predicted transcriptional regulator
MMSMITIRLPDSKHDRLKQLARGQNLSLNKLFEEWATVALAQQDAESNYLMRSQRGDVQRGLDLLDQLDSNFAISSAQQGLKSA